MSELRAPFPWFGGKTLAAPIIWERLGNVPNYVAPFAGALGAELQRPHPPGIETLNDLDGFICNAWRSVIYAPAETAAHADWPVNENDLHARHAWLVRQRSTMTQRLEGDPFYCDAQIAGWWLWGICAWIGSGWCSGVGPWGVEDGRLTNAGQGVHRQRPHLGDAGQGVHRQRPHLSAGQGVHRQHEGLHTWFQDLAARLRMVRVCCGDWQRVLTPSVTTKHGLTGILLDPPYSAEEDRTMGLYAIDSGTVAHQVREWCLEHGNNPQMRIVLCGYGMAHDMLLERGWSVVEWVTNGGMGKKGTRGSVNRMRERLWCSPHCLKDIQIKMF